MKTIRTMFAVMLIGLTFTAFQSDAQTRRSTGSSSSTRSTSRSASTSTSVRSTATTRTVTRPVSTVQQNKKPSTTVTRPTTSLSRQNNKPSGQIVRPSSQTTRPSGQTVRSSGQTTRPSTQAVRPSTGTQRKPSGTTTRPATRPATGKDKSPATVSRPTDRKPATVTRPVDRKPASEAKRPNVRPDKPVQVRPDRRPDVRRVHPRDRDFMHYSTPSYFWTGHNHYYGHRVRVLPTHVHRHYYYGVTYYCYNDIWYRPYGGYYVVCRPPFGTVLAANLIADMTWAAVRLSYYYTVANTYSQINDNNRYIAEQNAIIAQNNATIAAQNAQIAAGQQQAQAAYGLATQLGLVQSYAAAGSNYYYQDGVFYVMDASGQYKVIVPPAGAVVETLPEDYDLVVLSDGNEYYKVDDTIYKITITEGKPYFEVLGQLYS